MREFKEAKLNKENKEKMNLIMDGNARIDLINERIEIPIFFSNKIDFEGIRKDFEECLETLEDNEEEVLKEFK